MVLLGGPLGISLAPLIKKNMGGLYKSLKPLANAFAHASGYRQVGMRYDDLVIEERDDVQKAISRLPPREAYDRAFRLKRATQQSVLHVDLPKDQQIKPEEDIRYLAPLVEQVAKEEDERTAWDTMTIERKRK